MDNKEKIEILENARKLLHKEGHYRMSYILLDFVDEYADGKVSRVELPVKPESGVELLMAKLDFDYLTSRWIFDDFDIQGLPTAIFYIRKLVRECFNLNEE